MIILVSAARSSRARTIASRQDLNQFQWLRPRILSPLLALGIFGCGARSGLEVDPARGFDAGVDAAIAPPVDAAPPADAAVCARDSDCEDGVACTRDRCVAGRCSRALDDASCDDGRFCTGVERCDAMRGCVSTPPSCADAVACTEDVCDEALDACVSEPRASLCPISHRCDPTRGCVARALAHDEARLYEIDLPGGELHELGLTPVTLTDLALHPDGTLYGAISSALVRVDYEAGTATTVVAVPGSSFVGLDVSPDGTLYGAVDDRVDRLDPVRGTATPVARFPGGLLASGDLAFLEGRLYATVRGGRGGDWLVEVRLDGSRPRIAGATGFDCIWGLAPFGATLYGLTCEGRLITLDVESGRARELSRSATVSFWGAGAR